MNGASHDVPRSSRRGRTLGVVTALLVSTVAVWLSYGFTRRPPPPSPVAQGISVQGGHVLLDAGAPQWRSLQLAPASPAQPHATDRIPARVTLDEARTWRVGAPVAGRVTRVDVELGQRVEKGQPLFSVSSTDIAAFESDRQRAQLELEAARKSHERIAALVASRALAAKEELASALAVKQAELAADLASARLRALHVSSDPAEGSVYTVSAPRAGVVVEKNVFAAQEVGPDPAAPLVVVGDLGSVLVVADLFEANAADIRRGAEAQVTFPSLPGVVRPAVVDMVPSVYDRERHALPVRLRLGNEAGDLKPNMYAEVHLMAPPPPGAVEVRASAVISDGDDQFVYVQEREGEFARRKVVAGSVRGGMVPVLKGLKAGEVVVERGAILLDNQLSLTN